MKPRCSAIAVVVLLLAGCAVNEPAPEPRSVAGGNPARGRELVSRGTYGCTSCHDIPGMAGTRGIVAPPLSGFARRAFIAGVLANTPENLVGFLNNPAALVPRTGMPDVKLSVADARSVAAFLYTLEPE